MDAPSGDRTRIYIDPDQVEYIYDYDALGRVKTLNLSGENPISFEYVYDAEGNLNAIRQGLFQATYSNFQNGVPETMDWVHPSLNKTFNLTTDDGRLTQVTASDNSFLLDLTWSTDPSPDFQNPAELTQPMITQILRQGPGLKETLTPSYDTNERLKSIHIDRNDGQQIIEETYGDAINQLMPGFRRDLTHTVNTTPQTTTLVDYQNVIDSGADSRRTVAALSQADPDHSFAYTYNADLGNLETITYALGQTSSDHTFTYNGDRRITATDTSLSITNGGNTQTTTNTITYSYDIQQRRIRYNSDQLKNIVYARQGSRVIAIGNKHGQTVRWTHAIGYGPLGPVFVEDLIGQNSYFIFTDQVGTPFAYQNVISGLVFYTPYNPWGELLNVKPGVVTQSSETTPVYTTENLQTDAVTTFTLPPDSGFPTSPLGLSGHLYDHETGLVYMHNRYYHPRLGHFLTTDFRAPDLYDPTTFTEPYAYASGNPIIYWDPDGRASVHHNDSDARLEVTLEDGDTAEIIFDALSASFGDNNYLFREFNHKNSALRLWIQNAIRGKGIGDTIDFSEFWLLNQFAYDNLPKNPLLLFLSSSQPEKTHIPFRNLVLQRAMTSVGEDSPEFRALTNHYRNVLVEGMEMVKDIGIESGRQILVDEFATMGLGYGIAVMPKGGLTRLMSASAVESFDDFYSIFRHSNRGPSGPSKNYVYRVIRPDEMPHRGLTAKVPGDTHYTITGHVLHGSRPSFKGSRFISTTRDLEVARKYAAKDKRLIVRIDLNQVYSQIYDLSSQTGREKYLRGKMSRNWARKSAEVLIEDFIPPEAIDLIFTPD